MLVPVAAVAAESTVKGSRFLAELFPVAAQADVREKLKAQKAKYADATHVVHAFVAGSCFHNLNRLMLKENMSRGSA